MSAPLRLELFGVPALVEWGSGITHDGAARLAAAWSRCRAVPEAGTPAPGESRAAGGPAPSSVAGIGAVLTVGRAAPFAVESDTFAEFASELTSRLTVAAIEERAGELMMLHASGLADPATGRTVALVARSGMGKTTATRRLATRYGYVSDETVAIERSGRILPYPKPLSVIDAPPPAPKVQRGPDELGLVPPPAEARLAGVVLLERQPGLDAAVVEDVEHAEALTLLAPQTSALARIDRPLAWLCSLLDACGGAVRVRYTEAGQLTEVLPGVIARPPLAPAWQEAHDGAPVTAAGPGTGGVGHPGPGRVRRREVVDAVVVPREARGALEAREGGGVGEDPEVLVLAGSTLVRLGGIAPAVWASLAGTAGTAGITVDELAARLEESVGLPDGYAPILRSALAELGERGLVDVAS